MSKLVLILIASIAVVTFIRAFDNPEKMISPGFYSSEANTSGLDTEDYNTGETVSFVVE